MPNYRRPTATGSTVFFTVNLANPRSRYLTDHVDLLRGAVQEVRSEHPFAIDAWVVLPNHMHAIWSLPTGDKAYGQRWGTIKSKFTRALRKANIVSKDELRLAKQMLGHCGIWQPRFWEHHIRNDRAYRELLRYCWENPVKHGYVTNPHDWPYSSIHRDVPRGGVISLPTLTSEGRAGLRPASKVNFVARRRVKAPPYPNMQAED